MPESRFNDTWPRLLAGWFQGNQRQMPWRDEPTPYHVLVSEFMLQQTQVSTVIPYFHRFMHLFPTLESLANAPLEQVLKAWEGLGYYSRARHLHQCSQAVLKDYGGVLPDTFESLKALPGIGPYTAAAIASIAFGKSVPVVDGNVLRVYSRMTMDSSPVSSIAVRKRYFEELSRIIAETESPSVFNQAMMELGALVCKPQEADCSHCPLHSHCKASQSGTPLNYPAKTQKTPVPHYEVAVGLVYRQDGMLLILRRTEEQMLGGLWEFPGGKLEAGETPAQAAAREIMEETGLSVTVGPELALIRHAYSHFSITMHAFQCTLDGSDGVQCQRPWRWVAKNELSQYPFPKANHKIFAKLGINVK